MENQNSEEVVIKIDATNIPTEDDNLEVYSTRQDHSIVMYLDPNIDEKYYKKFIKGVEKLVRGNDDYKKWLESLREIEFMSKDVFLENITSDVAEIQLHHFPFNLYTICSAVTQRYFDEGKKVSSFIIADEVIGIHFSGLIGLVPLSVTNHELAHLQKLKIPRNQIHGEWENFFNLYVNYLDDYTIYQVKKLIEFECITLDKDFLSLLEYKKPKTTDISEELDLEE